jgi:hypothetical protein
MHRSFLFVVLLTAACGGSGADIGGGSPDAGNTAHDAALSDTSTRDTGARDAAAADTSVPSGSDSGAVDSGPTDDGGPIVSTDGASSDDGGGCPASPPVVGTPCSTPDLSCDWACQPGCDCVEETPGSYAWKCGIGPVPCDDGGTAYDANVPCDHAPSGNACVQCCADKHSEGRGDIMLFGQNCPMCSTCTGACATGPTFDCPISMPQSPCIACEQAGLTKCAMAPNWQTMCSGDCSAYVSCFLSCPQ